MPMPVWIVRTTSLSEPYIYNIEDPLWIIKIDSLMSLN
ncbi:hypothetical protein C1G87_1557 [Dehalococcoides mccartyi]|uniref:Uncharacterized protein n=1 Tax=Dehalococcoides mccartyi TaxID=61435 RepID=A0A328EJD0_9CHLR|nr:hypothetical protein C1G87_1557 [Dehalococcoides mccartyi]